MATIAELEATAPTLAASISRALADAHYPAAEPDVLAGAAMRLASWGGNLQGAIGDQTRVPEVGLPSQIQALLLRYGAAVKEAGHPDLIAGRLLMWAEWADAAAGRHEVTRADFAGRVERMTGKAGFEDQVVQFTATAAAAESCRDEHRASAASFRAQAAAVCPAARQAA